MRFRFPNKSPEEKIEDARAEIDRLEQWHDSFALIPRKVDKGVYVWLEYVERRGIPGMIVTNADNGNVTVQWHWEYREKVHRNPFDGIRPGDKQKIV